MSSLNKALRGIYRKENTVIQNQCEKQSLTPWEFQSIGNSIPAIITPSLLIYLSISALQFGSLCDGKHCYFPTLMFILHPPSILLEL